jgi:hypothetical protein
LSKRAVPHRQFTLDDIHQLSIGLSTPLNLVQEKKFQVIIDRSFPLAEARSAQRHLEGRGHFGKVVLKIAERAKSQKQTWLFSSPSPAQTDTVC